MSRHKIGNDGIGNDKIGDGGVRRVRQHPTHSSRHGQCFTLLLQASITLRMSRDYVEHPVCRQARTAMWCVRNGLVTQ